MLKKISLNAADKQVLNSLFSRLNKGDFETVKTVREIRRRFDLRNAVKQLDKLNEQLEDYGFRPISWEVLLDPVDYVTDIRERLADNPNRVVDLLQQLAEMLSNLDNLEDVGLDGLLAIAGDVLKIFDKDNLLSIEQDEQEKVQNILSNLEQLAQSVEHTIDDAYLKLLNGLLEEIDWSKVRVPVQGNTVREVDVLVPVAQMEAIGDLADKIFLAIKDGN